MYAIGIPFLKGVKYERGISKGKNLDLAAEPPVQIFVQYPCKS